MRDDRRVRVRLGGELDLAGGAPVLDDLDELEFVGMGGLGPLPMAAEAADGERLTFTVPPSSWAVRRLLALACFDGQLSLDGGST